VKYEVSFRPLAVLDLEQIEDFIARDSPLRAMDFVRRIQRQCALLAELPERGKPRDDLGLGIRTLSFERRVVIAYRIEADRVRIVRIFYGGQDYESDWRES